MNLNDSLSYYIMYKVIDRQNADGQTDGKTERGNIPRPWTKVWIAWMWDKIRHRLQNENQNYMIVLTAII